MKRSLLSSQFHYSVLTLDSILDFYLNWVPFDWKDRINTILDPRISVCSFVFPVFVTLRLPPLDSETGWAGDFWSKTKLVE